MRGTGVKATVAPEGQKAAASDALNTSIHAVSPEYFATMGLRLLEGRNYIEADARAKDPRSVIVNRAFARRFFRDGHAVGGRFGMGVETVVKPQFGLIGVVSDAKYRSLREPIPPTMYT